MKKIIKKVTATKGYRIAEAVALFPIQLLAFVLINTMGDLIFRIMEKRNEEV